MEDDAEGRRRAARPTVKVLKSLPVEMLPPDLRGVMARQAWGELELSDVDIPLLKDARMRFATGLPDRHYALTQAAGCPVYEVRDRQGAGWRGAVIVDHAGDPWLVYAAPHDKFHRTATNTVAKANREAFMPLEVDYRLRAREEAVLAWRAWEREVLMATLGSLGEAMQSEKRVCISLPVPPGSNDDRLGAGSTLKVSLDNGEAAASVAVSHEQLTMIQLWFELICSGSALEKLVGLIVPFLQPDQSLVDPVYGIDGNLHLDITITQARLAQLLAIDMADSIEDGQAGSAEAPSARHYVRQDLVVEGYVTGVTVRAVCGFWFVPTRDEYAELPICEACEARKPAAQTVIDLIRTRRIEIP